MKLSLIPVFVLLFFLSACETKTKEQEVLVSQHCGGCHLRPEPALLDKKSWEQGVLPEMAFRMGLKNPDFKLFIPPGDSAAVYGTLPSKPMVTEEEWEAIRDYYIENAPDSLPVPEQNSGLALSSFEVEPVVVAGMARPFMSMLAIDTVDHKVFAGTLTSTLYRFGQKWMREDSIALKSPPSNILLAKDGSMTISLLGILEPNEQAKGELTKLTAGNDNSLLIDSLQRPVHFAKADLNNDGLEDYVICDFGNYTGALLAFENRGSGRFARHVLLGVPGARKVVVKDINLDGLNDLMVLMTQGNEQIVMLTNLGKFQFASDALIRFPPVYGSSYFELVDFNRDGHFDILYTNGDNGDFSYVLKPYHGIRIFLNDGRNKFSESWFYPMYGASKAMAEDFDKDGDLDIAAISFFPDFDRHPEQGFLYLENSGKGYKPYSTRLAANGRWLVMDKGDIDQDGDCDLLLGAFDYDFHVPVNLNNQWGRDNVSILVLRNKLR